MPTEFIRPNATSAANNWTLTGGATVHGILSDSDTGTLLTQNNATGCNFTVSLGNLSVTDVEIIGVTAYISGKVSDRASSAQAAITVNLNGSCNLGSLEVGTNMSSHATSQRTTDGGEGTISVDEVNAMTLTLEASTHGIIIAETWVSVEYRTPVVTRTYDNTANHLNIADRGHINITSGNIFI